MIIEALLVVFILQAPEIGENYMDRNTITRVSAPHKYDQYPFGTRCKVMKGDKFDLYIQFSHNEDHPDWHMMGTYDGTDLDDYSKEMLDQIVELELE